MVLYKKKVISIFKFILAFIIFILGLTITFDDVYGINVPSSADKAYTEYQSDKIESTDDFNNYESRQDGEDYQSDLSTDDPSNDVVPTSVPEPSTIILIASGLGIIRLATRKKS